MTFPEAVTVCSDGLGLWLDDPEHEVAIMRKAYDFSHARRTPYAKRRKRSVTIRLDEATIGYFKALAEQSAIPYQTLINLYLRDCAARRKKVALRWTPSANGAA